MTMTRSWTVLVAGAIAVCLMTLPSAALDLKPEAQRTYDTAEECIQDQRAFEMKGCSSSGNGWVVEEQRTGPPGWFAAFMMFGLLWAALPAVISASVASSRGQSVGIAILLGIVLGWIGLLIVVLVMKPEVTRAANAFLQNPTQPPQRSWVPMQKNAETRLTELLALKDKGLVSDEEYDKRRQAILEEI